MLNQIQADMPDNHIWRNRIQYFETITSTNDVLKLQANNGAPEGTVLIANQQTGGRGRMGRTFLSPPDTGIYMSVLLRPECPAKDLMHLTCAAAVAACSGIEAAIGIRPGIKWTNDLVCSKKKIAGILTEMKLKQDGSVDYAIIGIGINCNQKQDDFAPDIRDFAGSLGMISGKNVDRAKLSAEMVKAFCEMNTHLLTDISGMISDYRKDCITLNQEVSLIRGDEIRTGFALDIDDAGALIVRLKDGSLETINSGEVSVRGLYQYV